MEKLKTGKVSRRRFFRWALSFAPVLAAGDAFALEPEWVKIRKFRLAGGKPAHRLVHFTDLHHKGDAGYLRAVVKKINVLSPDFVCFTGDIVEDALHLPEALEILRGIRSPMFGIPGNHDYWSNADFNVIAKSLSATGGAWLLDNEVPIAGGKVLVLGATCMKPLALKARPGMKNIMLIHYPEWVEKLGGNRFDLVLAGHSHGGQVRIPFYGPLMVPFGVGRYDLGLFQTAAGPLYVNAGIGYFYLNIRFNCRPEITVFEI